MEVVITFFKLYATILTSLFGLVIFITNATTSPLKIHHPKIELEQEEIFQIKNNIWNTILSAKDFENFDESVYFRNLEFYSHEKNLTTITPSTPEKKMALIEVIQNQFHYTILKEKHLEHITSSIKTFPQDFTKDNIQDFARELFIVLKAPPVNLIHYFTNDKTSQINKKIYPIVQEELLLNGLYHIINQFPEKVRAHMKKNAKHHIDNIIHKQAWRMSTLSSDATFINQVKISDELFEKILLEGLKTNTKELNKELILSFQNQNSIDSYEHFRMSYRSIAFAFALSFFYQEEFNHESQKTQDSIDQFKKFARIITNKQINKIIGQVR